MPSAWPSVDSLRGHNIIVNGRGDRTRREHPSHRTTAPVTGPVGGWTPLIGFRRAPRGYSHDIGTRADTARGSPQPFLNTPMTAPLDAAQVVGRPPQSVYQLAYVTPWHVAEAGGSRPFEPVGILVEPDPAPEGLDRTTRVGGNW